MAQIGVRTRRSPLRALRLAGMSEESSNIDFGLSQSFTSMDEHVIRLRTLRSSPRRRSSLLNTSEISLLGSPGMSPDSSFDTTFDTSFGSDISTSTPIVGPKILTDKIRKRLNMSMQGDFDAGTSKTVSPPKRKKTTKSTSEPSYKRKLSALTQEQLVRLFETLAEDRPDLKQDIERLLPVPDISPLLENLEYFRHNIYKSLPHSKWGSNRDSFCYRRVKTHIDNFKATCITNGKQLLESESWDAAIEYTLKAVDYVDRLPDWDNSAHNKAKQQCYKGLAAQCKAAIKHGTFDKKRLQEVKAQVGEAIKTAIDFAPCSELVDKKMAKCK